MSNYSLADGLSPESFKLYHAYAVKARKSEFYADILNVTNLTTYIGVTFFRDGLIFFLFNRDVFLKINFFFIFCCKFEALYVDKRTIVLVNQEKFSQN